MKNFLNILSVFVLMGGVIAGAVLVQNEQDIRNSAAPEDKVQICHKTGNGDEFKKIEIAEQAVQSHLDHGDKLSGCDEVQTQDPVQENTQAVTQTSAPATPAETAQPSQQPEASQTETPIAVSTSVPTQTKAPSDTTQEAINTNSNDSTVQNSNSQTNNQNNSSSNSQSTSTTNSTSDTPPVTVNTNTFVSPLNANVFNFRFKLQNVTKPGVTKNVTLTFYKSGKQMVRNLTVTSGENGVFSGNISGLDQGEYEVVLKVNAYLANRFKGVNVTTTDSSWDWTASRFKGVDFNHDNILNIVDVGMILAVYNKQSVPVTASNTLYDVNSDNIINKADIDIVLSYYTSLVVTGEF